eukprot:gnl/MRDRNA2_/MRDRNA2_88195_c0_seq1.p1 gnl/MRDRNA2_/MRDRNA2_88195_c0~~gnl/MRDRNA2_/MRDRNA2_88195_c0_seq1.p1  ORF type:complete len:398 (+),score=51.62 gnl/MRDRNA2_/MRDRNA2_88195_c0_seq1:75-1268(+)
MTLWSVAKRHEAGRSVCAKDGPKLAKQDSVARLGSLSLPVLIGRSKVMMTRTSPITDFEDLPDGSKCHTDSLNDVTSSSPSSIEAKSTPGTPLCNTETPARQTSQEQCTPPKKSFFFSPTARFQLSEKKWRSTRINPQDSSEGQDAVSTSASSDAEATTESTPSSSEGLTDDRSDTLSLSNAVSLEASATYASTNKSKDLLSVVQGHWLTLRETPVRVTGSEALWIRDSAIDLGGIISELHGKLQLVFSDGSIYTAELDETQTVLTWSDGDVWKFEGQCKVAPALTAPALSESFAHVLNADQSVMNPTRRADREPNLPATLSHQNIITVSHAHAQNCVNTRSLSSEQSCEEVSETPQIVRCKDGDLWLRFEDGRTYHAALQPEGAPQLGFAPLGDTL